MTNAAAPTSPSLILSVEEEEAGLTARITWREPTCKELRGPFQEYHYKVTGIDGKEAVINFFFFQ